MIRQKISPAGLFLLKELSPGASSLIRRCRSLIWKARNIAGERIQIEFELESEFERRRAKKLAARVPSIPIAIPGAILASLAVRLSDNAILFDALVIWS